MVIEVFDGMALAVGGHSLTLVQRHKRSSYYAIFVVNPSFEQERSVGQAQRTVALL